MKVQGHYSSKLVWIINWVKGIKIVNFIVTAQLVPKGRVKNFQNDAIYNLLYSRTSSRQTAYGHDDQGCLQQNYEIYGPWFRGSGVRVGSVV